MTSTRSALKPTRASPSVSADAGAASSDITASGNAIRVKRSTRISVLDRRSAVRQPMRRFRGRLDSGLTKPIFARARSLRRNGTPEMDKRIGLYAFGDQALGSGGTKPAEL